MNNLFKFSFKSLQHYQTKLISVRMSSNYLIQDSKYSFLKELGLSEKNMGVFAGHERWFGNGEVVESICPATNKKIAAVVQVFMN